MVHHLCGTTNPTAPCMINGVCSKGYPKDFRESTNINVDGYPRHKRPDDGRRAVKYLCKYVYKGSDRASLQLQNQARPNRYDEIRAHLDARYVCPPKALHHIFKYRSQFKSDVVYRLQVHLPDMQTVTLLPGQEGALQREGNRNSTLTAWFQLNADYELMLSEN
ncbi:hypothetical protein OESDEN_17201, partial [Oesophagostomum dentatum]